MTEQNGIAYLVWNHKGLVSFLLTLGILCVLFVPGVGALGAFLLAFICLLVGKKAGSFPDAGFCQPDSWARTLGITALYGLIIQLAFTTIFDPLFEILTGSVIDLSALDEGRGNIPTYLLWLLLGWIVGGFIEEVTFRGWIVSRVRSLLGESQLATTVAVLVAAIPFGLAHMYQGWAGVLSTGFIGLLLGIVYIKHNMNIWYAVFTHGFINTVGITFIYLDIDRQLNHLFF